MFWVLLVALWTAMLLSPIVLLFLFLPTGRGCPRCSQETLPIRSRMLRPARRVLSLRWCLGCGWQGITRHGARARPTPDYEPVREDAHETDSEAWRNNTTN